MGLGPDGAAALGSDTTTNPAFAGDKALTKSAVARIKSPRACVRRRGLADPQPRSERAVWMPTAGGSRANSAAIGDA